MPRQYNRTNYMKVDPSQMNKADLEKLIYNIASTVNARIDAAKKLAKADELLEIGMLCDVKETYEKLLNYFKNIDYDGYEFYKNEYISQYESDLEESYSL